MMGRQTDDQGHLFYDFCLAEAVPDDHPVRKIDAVVDLSWVYGEVGAVLSDNRPAFDLDVYETDFGRTKPKSSIFLRTWYPTSARFRPDVVNRRPIAKTTAEESLMRRHPQLGWE